MQHVKALIDMASEVCLSDAELARRLHVSRATISMMRSDKLKVSPEMAAMLADIAGGDAVEAMIAAVIEGAKGTAREALLRDILGKERAAGGVEVSDISYSGDLTKATETRQEALSKSKRPIHRIYSVVIQISTVIKSKVSRASFLQAKKRALAFG